MTEETPAPAWWKSVVAGNVGGITGLSISIYILENIHPNNPTIIKIYTYIYTYILLSC